MTHINRVDLLKANPVLDEAHLEKLGPKFQAFIKNTEKFIKSCLYNDNPYLETLEYIRSQGIHIYQRDLTELLKEKETAYRTIKNIMEENVLSGFIARDVLVWFFSWAIPTQEAIETCAKYGPLVEIGAGRGYWARCISRLGVYVLPFDNLADNWDKETHWHPIFEGSWEKAEIKNHTLFMCWPPYDNEMAYKALNRYEGDIFIYIGEGRGGCNGEDKFFDLLEKKWKIKETVNLPQWRGIHDGLEVYERI